MKLNVLFYSDAPNPRSLPADWPAEVREVADNAPAPALPWVEMTLNQYTAYRAARIGSVPQYTAAELAAIAAEQAEKDQIAAILAAADDMINGVGTTAQRQMRVENALGKLLKRLAKNGAIP